MQSIIDDVLKAVTENDVATCSASTAFVQTQYSSDDYPQDPLVMVAYDSEDDD